MAANCLSSDIPEHLDTNCRGHILGHSLHKLTSYVDKPHLEVRFVLKTVAFVYGCRSCLGKMPSVSIFLPKKTPDVDKQHSITKRINCSHVMLRDVRGKAVCGLSEL